MRTKGIGIIARAKNPSSEEAHRAPNFLYITPAKS